MKEIDKKIEEHSTKANFLILLILGISHFSGTSILAEHTAIIKKGSKYLRKTLYQIILSVIYHNEHNETFKAYYNLKISQSKGHRCAQGHCVRKILRIIYHLLKTNQQFDSTLLK